MPFERSLFTLLNLPRQGIRANWLEFLNSLRCPVRRDGTQLEFGRNSRSTPTTGYRPAPATSGGFAYGLGPRNAPRSGRLAETPTAAATSIGSKRTGLRAAQRVTTR